MDRVCTAAAGRGRAIALLLLLLSAPAARAVSAGVVVVVSPGALAYREALAGVQRALAGAPEVIDLAYTAPEDALGRLAASQPRALVAIGPAALQVAGLLPASTAVVAVLVPEPGGVAGLARSVYGVAPFAPPAAQLRELAALAPAARTLWTIHSDRAPAALLDQLRAAAARGGYRLVATAAEGPSGAARALADPPAEVGAFVLLPDPGVRNAAFDEALLRLAFDRRFPVVGVSRADVRAGALFALALEPGELGVQAADLARAAAATAPPPPAIVPPARCALVLNAAAAAHLGLPVPEELQRRAEVLGR